MYQIRNKTIRFKLPKLDFISISGFSRSKYRTGYLIQPYNIYLDAGLPCPITPNLILLSHSHLDHNAGLYSILIEGENTPVMLPDTDVANTKKMLNACGVKELKIHILTILMKLYLLKFLYLKKVERLNSAIVVLKMKKIFQKKMTFFLKKI